MKYDIEALQTFQDVLEWVKKEHWGICASIKLFKPHRYYELRDWMHHKYMPDKHPGEYWWPKNPKHYSDEVLEQAHKDRIQFLERIIEDIMCGE